MFLEKLEIQGFKSFATKNTLVFPGNLASGIKGLTAIVGPNGSGKSNVADAIRWVLGEQSMKTLRGKKSEDIIFSGSEKRGQLSMAEVSLFFNNEDNSSPIGYSQLVLTRRLYRNGDSEYLINSAKARLYDIQMLLAKANVGQKTYSVVGQGMVDSFLSTSLADRKEFFDEATGVKQYQIKRDESLNKLRGSLENLRQAQMLLSEIEPRLKSLTKQIQKLEKRSGLESQLNDCQLVYYRKHWHDLSDKLAEYNQKFLDIEKIKFDKDKRITQINQELEQLNQAEQENTVAEDFGRLQRELNHLYARRDDVSRQLTRFEQWINLKQDNSGQIDTSELRSSQQQAQVLVNQLEEDLKTTREQAPNREELSIKQRELNQIQAERDNLSKEASRLDAYLELKLESMGQYDMAFLNNKKTELSQNLEVVADEMSQLELLMLQFDNKLTSYNQARTDVASKVQNLKQEIFNIKNSSQGQKLTQQVNDYLQDSLKALTIAETEADWLKLKEILIQVKQELQQALDLSTGTTYRVQIETLEQDLDQLNRDREEIALKTNETQLEANTKKEQIRLLKQKQAQLTAELLNVEKKLKQGEEKIDIGSLKLDRDNLNKQIAPLVIRINELKELINQGYQEQENYQAVLSQKQQALQMAQFELGQLNNKLNAFGMEAAKQQARLEDLEVEIRKFANNVNLLINQDYLKPQRLVLEKELQANRDTVSSIKDEIAKFNLKQQERRDHLFSLQKNSQVLQQEINVLANQLSELQINATRYETRLEDLETEIRLNEEVISLKQVREARVDDSVNLEELGAKIIQIKKQLEQIGSIDPEVEKEYIETSERYNFLSGQVNDLTQAIDSLEEIIKELDVVIKEKFDAEFKVIAEKFEEYFKILFNGGSAKIIKVLAEEMTEEEKVPLTEGSEITPITETAVNLDDQLQKRIKLLQKSDSKGLAGIEIQATPPGKKIKSIAILSGGERALVSIALICAIISANPSPFVVLDEVDAALDEANSERLAKILDDLSNKTQFITITHNRASMRRAAILYGVAMQDDGASKLLSIKLEDAKFKG